MMDFDRAHRIYRRIADTMTWGEAIDAKVYWEEQFKRYPGAITSLPLVAVSLRLARFERFM